MPGMHLMIGGTGDLGFDLVQRLLRNGHDVRAMVRSDDAERRLRDAGAETVRGDLKERPSLERACQGIECVVSTANAVKRGGADTIEAVDRQGHHDLVDAAMAAGVRRFVFVSVAGADPSHPFPLFAAKGQTEAHIVASGMPYVIVQPHAFMDVWYPMVLGQALQGGAPVPLYEEGRKRHSFVAAADVAAFTVAGVENAATTNRRLLVGGPSAHSWSEVVDECGKRLGRELRVHHASAGDPFPGAPAPLDGLLGAMLTNMERADVIIEMQPLYDELGIEPTSLEQYLDRFLVRT
jgi:NADH dehydrogenase